MKIVSNAPDGNDGREENQKSENVNVPLSSEAV
jgi:hypothetical protein